MMWGDCMGWGMGWAWVFGILLIVGTVVLVFVLVKAVTGGTRHSGGSEPPSTGTRPARGREILDERYARGEISTEEYQERLRVLEEGGR